MDNSLVLARRGPQPGQRFALQMPVYMLENWKMVLGLFDEEDPLSAKIRFIRVKNKVATISQNDILIRTPLNAPDGFYELSAEGELVFADVCEEDVRSSASSSIPFSENIPREGIHHLLNWVVGCHESCPQPEKATIVIDEPGFICEHDGQRRFQFPSATNPHRALGLPIRGEPLFVSAFHLRLALTEATRYDTVVIAYERHPDKLTPLFIGRNWSQCVLIMPKPPYLRHTRFHGQQLR